jgi:hypothetical protein
MEFFKNFSLNKLIVLVGTIVLTMSLTLTAVTHGFGGIVKEDYTYEIYRSRTELAMEGCRDSIVSEIDKYIYSVAPESALNGIKLFELCDTYEVDVRFVMAQAQAESHFGTTGIAAKTNIVWNVKAYDGRRAIDMLKSGDCVKHPDYSIEPYLKLLTTSYLVNGKTEADMFQNFVDINGKRYASNQNYETLLFNIYNKINSSTNLNKLLKEWNKYKIILNK